jgi:uncharacterized membrane protein YeaQ/YmgE (transglycosylase-associated protein family)
MPRLVERTNAWIRGHTLLVGAIIAGSIAGVLYARTPGFGFFGDDPTGHFRWIETVPWTQWFTSSPGNFVRPLVFIIYRLLWLVQGGYGAPGYHATLLFLHVANTVLVGILASALSRRQSFGWLAAILFATFPLSQEAISEVDALCHPLLVFWALLALVMFEHGRQTGQRRYRWAVHLLVALALLTHENGLVIPFLLLALDLLFWTPRSLQELVRSPALPYFVWPILFLFWWLQIPKAATAAPRTVDGLLRNTLPFLQVVAYPWLPFARLDVTQVSWLVILAGVTLMVTGLAARILHLVRLWLFAIVWLLLAAAPAVLFLEWDYLFGGPRLYYLASVGAALLWAAPPLALISLATGSWGRRAAFLGSGVILALALVLPPVPFINCQLDLFDQTTSLLRQISTSAETAPAGRDLVYINLPAFFISNAAHPQGCPPYYPFVSTGVGVFPPYADLRDFVRVNGGPDRPAAGRAVPEYNAGWPPRFGEVLPVTSMREILRHAEVFVFESDSWTLHNLSAIWQPDTPASRAPLATFGDLLDLEGVTLRQAGGDLTATVQWRLRQPVGQPLTAFVHVYDQTGKLVAQHDGALGRSGSPVDYLPFSLWQTGDLILDSHLVPVGFPVLPDDYRVAVGIYDPVTLARLPVRTPQGDAQQEDLYVVSQ